MNYLAHAYLSFGNADILAGNMISDFVKGKLKYSYPSGIQNGIQLHRLIDTFTDNHQATVHAKIFFKPIYRLYAGAFVDVVYDHFLALDQRQFEKYNGLKKFSAKTYHLLDENFHLFPERFQKMFPYMKSQDWLYNYQFKEGIQHSFEGLRRRAKYIDEIMPAFEIFNKHYDLFQQCYNQFFPDVLQFAEKIFNEICTT